MATKLSKPVEREVRIDGIAAPVIITLAQHSLSARVKGSRNVVFADFTRLIAAMMTYADVPSFLYGKPLELLKHDAVKKSTGKTTRHTTQAVEAPSIQSVRGHNSEQTKPIISKSLSGKRRPRRDEKKAAKTS